MQSRSRKDEAVMSEEGNSYRVTTSPTPGWRCPHCKDKKCRAYDRTEATLTMTPYCKGARRQKQKDQIRELQACKKRMHK